MTINVSSYYQMKRKKKKNKCKPQLKICADNSIKFMTLYLRVDFQHFMNIDLLLHLSPLVHSHYKNLVCYILFCNPQTEHNLKHVTHLVLHSRHILSTAVVPPVFRSSFLFQSPGRETLGGAWSMFVACSEERIQCWYRLGAQIIGG